MRLNFYYEYNPEALLAEYKRQEILVFGFPLKGSILLIYDWRNVSMTNAFRGAPICPICRKPGIIDGCALVKFDSSYAEVCFDYSEKYGAEELTARLNSVKDSLVQVDYKLIHGVEDLAFDEWKL